MWCAHRHSPIVVRAVDEAVTTRHTREKAQSLAVWQVRSWWEVALVHAVRVSRAVGGSQFSATVEVGFSVHVSLRGAGVSGPIGLPGSQDIVGRLQGRVSKLYVSFFRLIDTAASLATHLSGLGRSQHHGGVEGNGEEGERTHDYEVWMVEVVLERVCETERVSWL